MFLALARCNNPGDEKYSSKVDKPGAGFQDVHVKSLIFPQIAIAIGVLTSNRREGDEPLLRIGRGTRMPLQGAVDVVPLLGAFVGCHCSVPRLSGRGAIAGCLRRVPL